MKARWLVVGLAVAVAALVPSMGRAASPEGGSVGPSNTSVSWTGGPFAVDPIVCTGEADPTCDHYLLTVENYSGHAAVTVRVEADSPDADVDLEVYRAGEQVGSSARRTGADEVTLWDPAPGTFEVRVTPYTARGATYSGAATFAPLADPPTFEGDVSYDCLDAAPDYAGVPAITDTGRNIALNVLVLLDSGVPQSEGEEMIAIAQAKSYDGVRVTLNATYEAVSFPSDGDYDSGSFGGVRGSAEGTRLLEDAKAHVGGEATGNVDVVYVLSNKDLWSTDVDGSQSYGLLGVADCIGGIRYDDRSFVVGEWITGDAYSYVIDDNVPSRAVRVYGHLTSKIFAHELGHILGAHHHYGNCAQGLSSDDMLLADVAPCTLMFPDASLISHEFGSLEAAVVRGYTANHA